jgi:hypothetical protein
VRHIVTVHRFLSGDLTDLRHVLIFPFCNFQYYFSSKQRAKVLHFFGLRKGLSKKITPRQEESRFSSAPAAFAVR